MAGFNATSPEITNTATPFSATTVCIAMLNMAWHLIRA